MVKLSNLNLLNLSITKSKPKLFVTGGTGFIGSHFVNQAHEAGYEIRALRRNPNSKTRIPLLKEPEWLDLALDKLEPVHFSGCNVLVHLAAHSPNVPYDSYSNCMYWNVVSAVRMFEMAHTAGINYWLVAGSCFEYGLSGECYDFIPKDATLEPTLSYPASKAAASIAFSSLARNINARLYLGRIFQVYGEGEQEGRLWPSLRKAALAGEDFPMTKGEQVRDFVAVEAVAKKFLEMIDGNIQPGQPFIEHVASGTPQTILEFSKFWWEKWGATGNLKIGEKPYRKGEVMRYVPKISVRNEK